MNGCVHHRGPLVLHLQLKAQAASSLFVFKASKNTETKRKKRMKCNPG